MVRTDRRRGDDVQTVDLPAHVGTRRGPRAGLVTLARGWRHHRGVRTRLGLLLAMACAVLGASLLLGAPTASAHALLVRSDPSSGATVATSPNTIELWFNEEITLGLSSVRVVHSAGAVVAGTRLVSASGDPRLLQLSLPPLPNDSYGVLWTATAEDDGHTTTGTVVFGVGVSVAPEAASDAASAPSMADVVRRWIRIGTLAGVVGATGILLIFLWIGADPRVELTVTAVERRMFLLAVWSAVAGVGVAAVDGIVQVARVTPGSGRDWLAVFSSTTWGHLWLLRVAGLAALLVVTLVLRRSLRVRPGLALLSAALVLALVVIEALGSHAASVESARPAAMLAEAVHILAGCIWVGVVLALAVMLWRPAVDGLDRRVLLRMIGRPLAVVLLASVGIVIVSGLYTAGRQVETVSDLGTTGYGRALLIKTGLLVVLLALGTLNAIRLHGLHLPGRGRPITPVPVVSTRLIVAEAAVGAVLLIVAGLLADSAPSRETATPVASSATEAAASAVERTEAGSVADLVVTVSATPNRPGLNAFTVTAASSRRPAPRPIDTVSLEVVGAKSTVSPPLQPIGAGRYFGVARLDSGPVREMRAVIERNGEQLGVTVPWSVSAATDTARLAPYVNTLAASLTVAFLGLVVGWFVLRRRRAEMKLPDMAEWELVTASSRSVRATATSSDPLAEVVDLDRRDSPEP